MFPTAETFPPYRTRANHVELYNLIADVKEMAEDQRRFIRRYGWRVRALPEEARVLLDQHIEDANDARANFKVAVDYFFTLDRENPRMVSRYVFRDLEDYLGEMKHCLECVDDVLDEHDAFEDDDEEQPRPFRRRRSRHLRL